MFNIPKRNFKSDTESDVIAVRLPEKMRKALKKCTDDLGLSHNELMSLVLDQYIAAVMARKSVVKSKGTYEEGKLATVTIRVDSALLEAIDKTADIQRPKYSRTQVVISAFDCYLCESM